MEDYISTFHEVGVDDTNEYDTSVPDTDELSDGTVDDSNTRRLELQRRNREKQKSLQDQPDDNTVAAAGVAGARFVDPYSKIQGSGKSSSSGKMNLTGMSNLIETITGTTALDTGGESGLATAEAVSADAGVEGLGTEVGIEAGGGETLATAGEGLGGTLGTIGAFIGGMFGREYLGSNSGTGVVTGSYHQDWHNAGNMMDDFWPSAGSALSGDFSDVNFMDLTEPGWLMSVGGEGGYFSGMGGWDPFGDVGGWFGMSRSGGKTGSDDADHVR